MELTEHQTREFLRKLREEPLRGADDELYVPLDGVRGYSKVTSVDTLLKALINAEDACLLISGFPGSGKTTELRKLKERLAPTKEGNDKRQPATSRPTEVVHINGQDYFDLYQPLNVIDILRVIAFHLDETATFVKTGRKEKKSGFVQKLVDLIKNTKIEFLTKIDFGQYTGGTVDLMAEFKVNPTFLEAAHKAIEERAQAFFEMARQSIRESVDSIRKIKGENTRVVVILDALEKNQPINEKQRPIFEKSVESVFVNQAAQLRIPCAVIYTFPLWLMYRFPLKNHYDARPLVLPMVKIWDRESNKDHTAGYEAMKEVLRKRIDLKAVFGEENSPLLHEIIRLSGGYLRDLFRIVRELILRGDDFPVTKAFVDDVIVSIRQEHEQTLLGTDMDVLAEVATQHKPPQDSKRRMATFARLYEHGMILAYRNGDEWYDVHPLIKDNSMLKKAIKKIQTSENTSGS